MKVGQVRIAMVGTRGVPARYGGFETAVEEIGRRLVERGHDVTVYCRSTDAAPTSSHLGMQRVVLPAWRRKSLETMSHTLMSAFDSLRRPRFDVVILFNSANSLFVPIFRRRRTPVAVHVDGLESHRSKWGGIGRYYYRAAEALSVRWADALIADAASIRCYYTDEFDASTELIAYGATLLDDLDEDGLVEFGVVPGRYHLVVARFEPENQIDLIVRAYRKSKATWPLLVVGGAPYSTGYVANVNDLADGDERIHLVGSVWDQPVLDRLYHHAGTYVHGHSVGGTNPSLLRAMGAGTPIVAYDVVFAREVLGGAGRYFSNVDGLAAQLEAAENDPVELQERSARLRDRAASAYRWDDVADRYEQLAKRLVAGDSRRREVAGRRNPRSPWRRLESPPTFSDLDGRGIPFGAESGQDDERSSGGSRDD